MKKPSSTKYKPPKKYKKKHSTKRVPLPESSRPSTEGVKKSLANAQRKRKRREQVEYNLNRIHEMTEREKLPSEREAERQARLEKQRQRYREKRAAETPEEREARLAKQRQKYREKRAAETPEERETRLAQQRQRYREKRDAETQEEREARLEKQREKTKSSQKSVAETPEEREARLAKQRQKYREKRDAETPEEREVRLAKERERRKKRKEKNKEQPKDVIEDSDKILQELEEKIALWEPDSDWSSNFAEAKREDRNKAARILQGAISTEGRNIIARRCEENAERIQYLTDRILYGSDGRNRGGVSTQEALVELASILWGRIPTPTEAIEIQDSDIDTSED